MTISALPRSVPDVLQRIMLLLDPPPGPEVPDKDEVQSTEKAS